MFVPAWVWFLNLKFPLPQKPAIPRSEILFPAHSPFLWTLSFCFSQAPVRRSKSLSWMAGEELLISRNLSFSSSGQNNHCQGRRQLLKKEKRLAFLLFCRCRNQFRVDRGGSASDQRPIAGPPPGYITKAILWFCLRYRNPSRIGTTAEAYRCFRRGSRIPEVHHSFDQ